MTGKKKDENLEDEAPFVELTKRLDEEQNIPDLESKKIEYPANRNAVREPFGGAAILYDLSEKILSKAELKNLSIKGISLEVGPIEAKANDEVFVQFRGAMDLGMVLCSIQWVKAIEAHRENHILLGLKFKKLTLLKEKKLEEFLVELQKNREKDPFYVR
jgi:hypothetical protein